MFTTAGLTRSAKSEKEPGTVPSIAEAVGISGAPETISRRKLHERVWREGHADRRDRRFEALQAPRIAQRLSTF